jgi:hypothetical protein
VRIAGKRQAGKGVVAARREQHERIPALAPGGGDGVARLEDREPSRRAGEEAPDRQAGLAGADDGDVETLARIAGRPVHRACRVFGHVHA